MKIEIAFLVFMTGQLLAAQTLEIRDQPLDVAAYHVDLANRGLADVEGSPYLYADFLPARINDIKETKFVRFNAADNAIEVKVDKKQALTLQQSEGFTMPRAPCVFLYLNWYMKAMGLPFTARNASSLYRNPKRNSPMRTMSPTST